MNVIVVSVVPVRYSLEDNVCAFEVDARGSQELQCFDGCTASPALLGSESTIGDCCGLKGRSGGGFLLAGSDSCIDCTNFRST